MVASIHLDVTPEQQRLLLEGLRYVRSARRLTIREPSAPPDPQRESDLTQISRLMERLQVATETGVPASVNT
jgi:hypothetical protein